MKFSAPRRAEQRVPPAHRESESRRCNHFEKGDCKTKERGKIAMNTSIYQASDLLGEVGVGECFFAAAIELDYDEPNAVVDQDSIEFVSAAEVAITAVELPVVTVIEEPATKPVTVPAQRIAA